MLKATLTCTLQKLGLSQPSLKTVRSLYANLRLPALALAGIVFPMAYSHAATVSGTITDTSGAPVEGVRVYVEGSNIEVRSDAEGKYSILDVDPEHVHLHAYSIDHVHADKDFDNIADQLNVDFVLRPTRVENVLVTANSLSDSVLESITPTSVLLGDKLRTQQAPTLGDTLANLPGIHSSAFGPVASTPVIRGTDGPRVKIVQNGLDVSDASRVGPDHNIATEASTATQIEVLRGPATLQYGSGAIGGVVNVVDNRIPTQVPDEVTGEAEIRFDTVSDEEYAKIDLNAGSGPVAFHVDAFTRETEDYEIPGFAEQFPDEGESPGVLEGSAIDTHNFTAGVSLVGEQGYIGVSYQKLQNFYGVPGHHEEEEEEEEEGESHEEEEEELVNIDVDLDRYQLNGEWFSPVDGITSIQLRSAYSEYQHIEFEGAEQGTIFSNDTLETRLSVFHEAIAGWHGVVGFHYANVDYAADGDEAFTPPNETDSFALYVVEQKRVGDVTYELGGRIERTELSVNEPVEIEIPEGSTPQTFIVPDQDFTSFSLSAGSIWDYQEGYSLALSLTHSERAPSHQELFSAGVHLSTRTYDLGAAFLLDDLGQVSLNNDINEEISNNLDITWRKYEGSTNFTVSLFYNQINDYLFQVNTGQFVDEFPIFQILQEDATLSGIEGEVSFALSPYVTLSFLGDVINASLDDVSGNDNLPRIPPLRLGTNLDLNYGSWFGNIGANWYDDQDDNAPFETTTDGYTLVDASINYRFNALSSEWTAFIRGKNLTDEEARPHTSFIKDLAPLAGRSFAFGLRTKF